MAHIEEDGFESFHLTMPPIPKRRPIAKTIGLALSSPVASS